MAVRPLTEQEKAARLAAQPERPPSHDATYGASDRTATYRDKTSTEEGDDRADDHQSA